MNLYLGKSCIESWSESWKKTKPKIFLTLYEEDNVEITPMEIRILKCPSVHRTLVQLKQSVLLTFELQKDGLPDLPLLFPTLNSFVEDTIFHLIGSGDSFEDINREFLPAVNHIKKLVLRENRKSLVNLFCLGETIDFDIFKVWKQKLQRSLKNKSHLIEIRIYIFNDRPTTILPLCEGLTIFNLSRDPHVRYTVYQKLKYMYVRSHGACTCKLISAIGRIIYNDEDRSYLKPFTSKRKLELIDIPTLKKKKREAEEKTDELEHKLRCKICLDKEIKICYLPCKHLAVCERCHEIQLSDDDNFHNCPVCRQPVMDSHEIFL